MSLVSWRSVLLVVRVVTTDLTSASDSRVASTWLALKGKAYSNDSKLIMDCVAGMTLRECETHCTSKKRESPCLGISYEPAAERCCRYKVRRNDSLLDDVPGTTFYERPICSNDEPETMCKHKGVCDDNLVCQCHRLWIGLHCALKNKIAEPHEIERGLETGLLLAGVLIAIVLIFIGVFVYRKVRKLQSSQPLEKVNVVYDRGGGSGKERLK